MRFAETIFGIKVPYIIWDNVRRFWYFLIVNKYNNLKQYDRIASKIKTKEKIKVAFFIVREAVWKLDELYWLMKRSRRFEPIVVICPWVESSNNLFTFQELNKVEAFCKEKGYDFISTYNHESGDWKDIKELIKPDIVFFTYPYVSFMRKEYCITNFVDVSLTCYATYGFNLDRKQYRQFNLLFHNLMWKGFYETSVHKMLAGKYAYNKGKNVEAVGYPLFDEFEKAEQQAAKDVWKIKDRRIKRIIWAPHHTFDGVKGETQFSCFQYYAQFMLEIAKMYRDKIQIAFKPHPTLKPKLLRMWGEYETNSYYAQWETLANGQLEEGEYVHLFLTSDAMIFDSVSFICEYMYTGKPSLFTMIDAKTLPLFNEFGEMAFKCLYHSYSEDDVKHFIENVVLCSDDSMKQERDMFFQQYLTPINNHTPSQNIFNYLERVLKFH